MSGDRGENVPCPRYTRSASSRDFAARMHETAIAHRCQQCGQRKIKAQYPGSQITLGNLYRMARPEGFAVQLVYTDDRSLDEAIQVRDGDVVLVPRGYHPVAAGPGYDLYYLNVMAGPRRRWLVTTDPAHRWQLD